MDLRLNSITCKICQVFFTEWLKYTNNVTFTSILGSVIVYTRVKVSKYFNQYSVVQKSCFSKRVYVNLKNQIKD